MEDDDDDDDEEEVDEEERFKEEGADGVDKVTGVAILIE